MSARGDRRGGLVRVLHVISGGMFGGGQRVVADLLEYFSRSGTVDARLCLLQRDEKRFSAFDHEVIAYSGNYRNPWVAFPVARELTKLIRRLKPDIVHSHGYDAELIAALACGWAKVVHISHLHDTPEWIRSPKLKHKLRRLVTRVITREAGTYWIACAEAVRQLAVAQLKFPRHRTFTVRNCVRSELFARLPIKDETFDGETPCIVGSVGRLARNKGFELLIQVVHRLIGEGLNLRLLIAGDGPERERLQRFIDDRPGKNRMSLVGWVEPIVTFYRGLSLFCLPSLSGEGLPLVILEAMAAGLPVVSTDVMGASEIVVEGQTGLLVPPGDVQALRGAILRLYQDRALRARLAHRARAFVVENHSMENMIGQLEKIYSALLDGARSRRSQHS